ncbi:DNA protecting protein DprA [Desulfocicer vacuolatum DSM 3385]|uniref:DNA protecting protein DprA n=1 Tax=Desulfocicer vacuolatum DSM 3385 TaxID=1121400 RepID=A0A1W2B981_9BACT|nr:DNA-processing protein DprA [Desulfocicer vacuolatum]SMC69350.1 DNA protecting protein DprA [Desulfocicer vacuolatum DSM 3385]
MNGLIDKYRPWFALKNVPGLGSVTFKRLITTFGSPQGVFDAPDHELKAIKGMGPRIFKGIHKNRTHCPDDEIRAIERCGFKIAALTDPHYPELLLHIPDPPPILTYLGTLDNIAPCIAIVGSRQATAYGIDTAFKLGCKLAARGFQIVSGMAMGIDTAAHKGAIHARGRTLAVMGCGLKIIYPRENRQLYHEIADNGAVISELPIHSSPDAHHFPMRNRIIAGMSTGTVVVEAAAKSGSLITARLTAEYNREMFAVPGSIHSFKSTGTHALLKQGAKLVENELDVIEELGHLVHQSPPSQPIAAPGGTETHFLEPDSVHAKILNCLGPYPVHIDTIIETSGLDAGAVNASLLCLELKGVIKQTPGKFFFTVEETP